MALDKVTYVDDVTVIHADNLNDIQDEIIRNASDISALDTALSGKVSKAGDTMTGDLILQDGSCITQDTRITSGTAPSSDIYGKSVYLNDSARFNVGTWQIMSLVNGREGFQLVAGKKVNDVNKFNYIRMLVDANGNPVVEMNGSAAWRSALGLGTSGALPITVAQGGTGQTAVTGTTTISQIATAASGFTIVSASYYQWGKLAMLYMQVKTATAVTSDTNMAVATLVSGKRPIFQALAVPLATTYRYCYISSDGTVHMRGTMPANTDQSLHAIYLLA